MSCRRKEDKGLLARRAWEKGDKSIKTLEYKQVKERVAEESRVLGKLVIEIGIGMLAVLLIVLAVIC